MFLANMRDDERKPRAEAWMERKAYVGRSRAVKPRKVTATPSRRLPWSSPLENVMPDARLLKGRMISVKRDSIHQERYLGWNDPP